MQLANRRTATAKVKHRGDVIGSTRKLFRQKGTGRARRGDVKSPLLKGGGVVFGPDGRKYAYKAPKKVRRLALKMALSSKFQQNALRVMNDFELDEIKTSKFVNIMNTLDLKKALIITDKDNRNLELSSRNVPEVKVLRTEGLNVYDILKYDFLVLIQGSLEGIEGRLLK
ncbi:MAG: 50S ribosomal protein L4, partial [Desulfobacterales bacterium]|nr:50S ribosomal protein L4 [Desulfobacterales bacterium]